MNTQDVLIVYVDDERANRVVFEQSFVGEFRIKTAGSGTEALALLKNEPVGVLVTDQRMPDMSGNDLLAAAKEGHPDVVRVVITAYSDLDPIIRAVNEGLVARYIIKPWVHEELKQILDWAVEAYAAGKTNSAIHLRLLQTERLVTIGSIGAAVIHDINQPLSYMNANCERLAQLSGGIKAVRRLVADHGDSLDHPEKAALTDLAEELPEIAGDMLQGCKVMCDLTASLRQLLNPPKEREVSATDPLPVIRYAISVCREKAADAQARITYDGPAKLPFVHFGSTELTQVFINVIANAVQAFLAVRRPEAVVAIDARTEKTLVHFTVTDNGPGMAPEVIEKVGQPFFTTRPDGTGLGVAQCKRLLAREGGTFVIESQPGHGTTVTLTVPIAND
jgi:signal transduction histidine kinase